MDVLECPICYLPLNRSLKFVKCRHKVCLICAVKWLSKKNLCPICRAPSSHLMVFDRHRVDQVSPQMPPLLEPSEQVPSTHLNNVSVDLNATEGAPLTEGLGRCPTFDEKVQKSCNYFEKQMSVPELISVYWPQVSLEFQKKENSNSYKDEEGEIEEIDISIFVENLNEVVLLTKKVRKNLEGFDNHIFYSELYDVVEDISRTQKYYSKCVEERDPLVSKYKLACFVEHIFKFLTELNRSLEERDTGMVHFMLGQVDDVYYAAYLEYYFRGYEEEEEWEEDIPE